jgi:hypothetical protein
MIVPADDAAFKAHHDNRVECCVQHRLQTSMKGAPTQVHFAVNTDFFKLFQRLRAL